NPPGTPVIPPAYSQTKNCAPTFLVAPDPQRDPEGGGERAVGEHLRERPRGDDAARTEQQRVGEAGRDLLDVVGDEHEHRRPRVAGELREVADERLPGAEVQPGGRLVEEHEL